MVCPSPRYQIIQPLIKQQFRFIIRYSVLISHVQYPEPNTKYEPSFEWEQNAKVYALKR